MYARPPAGVTRPAASPAAWTPSSTQPCTACRRSVSRAAPPAVRARRGRASRHVFLRVEGGNGGEEDAQAEVDEVDIRDCERDVPGDHDALVEHAVDELDQGDLTLEGKARCHSSAPASAKL